MRALIWVGLLCIVATCGGRPAQPLAYPPFEVPGRDSSPSVRTSALVLIPLSNQAEAFSKSAALLSSLCDWIRQTPDVRRRYSSVWLAVNSKQDPIGSAALSMEEFGDLGNSVRRNGLQDIFKRLRRWLKLEQDSQLDYRGVAKEVVTKSFQLSNRRVEAYACFGDTTASTEEVSVLALEHTRIEPYGPGIAYFVATPKGGKHGYVILKGDSFERDVGRVAALTLSASEEEVIRAGISLDIPPDGRCSGDADLPCVYLAFQTMVSAVISTSTFASARDVEVREWRVEDESGTRGTAIVAPTISSQERAVLTFTRPGTFRVVARLSTRTEPPLWLERSVRIAVRTPSLIIFNDPPVLDDQYEIGVSPLHRFGLNVSCRTLCQPLTGEDVDSVMKHAATGVVRSQDVERVLAETSKAFGSFDLSSWASFEPAWRSASEAALGYKQVADLVTRPSAAQRDEWCGAVSDSISSSLLKTGVRAPAGLAASWQMQCGKYASHIKLDIVSIGDAATARRHVSGERLLESADVDIGQHVPIGTEVIVVRALIKGSEDTVPFILNLSTQKVESFRLVPGVELVMERIEGFDGRSYRHWASYPIAELSWRLSVFTYLGLPVTRKLGDVETSVLYDRLGLAPWCLATDWYPQLLHAICQRAGLKLLLGVQFERNAHSLDGPVSRGPIFELGVGTTIAIPIGRTGLSIAGGSALVFTTRGWSASGSLGVAMWTWL